MVRLAGTGGAVGEVVQPDLHADGPGPLHMDRGVLVDVAGTLAGLDDRRLDAALGERLPVRHGQAVDLADGAALVVAEVDDEDGLSHSAAPR